ncbi:hypothetical protein [Litoribaculum gwangyangense]|uniref:Uncharacterized protein n=1 Tax=Litoribaculum gwangyangense TaxID=1130722 RepID=A0ABP9C8G9_9FLAO
MKTRFVILIFCLGLFNNTLGQILTKDLNQTPQELYEFHIQKKKDNLTAAWIALFGGVAMIAGGTAINIDNCLFSGCDDGMVLVYSGLGIGLSSFVFFEKAGNHKKKAKIQLQNGAVGFNRDIKYSGISIRYTF